MSVMPGDRPQGWFADILLERSAREARSAALALLADGVPVRSIYLDVLAPGLVEVGERWQHGVISVAQEHLASATVASILGSLAPRLGERPSNGFEVVLACTDTELHAIGLRMVADFLEADGYGIVYLGGLTPGAELVEIVSRRHPAAVCLSTTLVSQLESARAVIASLRRVQRPPFILVGGRAYAGDAVLARSLGADAFAADAGQASPILEAALTGR